MSEDTEIISPDAEAQTAESDEQQGETSAPEKEAQTQEGLGEGEDQDEEGDGEKKPKPDPVQKRINEITRARREAEARAASLEKLVLNLAHGQQQGAQASSQAAPEQQEEQPPKESDFQDYAAYQRAHMLFEARQAARAEFHAERERAQAGSQQAEQSRQQQESQQRAGKMIESGRAAFDDFDDVVMGPAVRITPVMADAMAMDAKIGSSVAYYLGKAPEESVRIAALPPVQQIMEIGRLAEKISASANKNKITKAPPPAKPVSGRSRTVADESKLSDDAWMRKRRAGK
jgi:hypothetical protein